MPKTGSSVSRSYPVRGARCVAIKDIITPRGVVPRGQCGEFLQTARHPIRGPLFRVKWDGGSEEDVCGNSVAIESHRPK